ncbi:MAG: hypothetical protein EAZ08_07790 [Cytophagales bacterium]|nr:MAG: hypothetical protein EAZ08_07790 [Cytophagales bacterium]
MGSSTPVIDKLPLVVTTENKTNLDAQLSLKKVKHKTKPSITAEQSFRQEDENLQNSLIADKLMITWDSVANMVKRRESLQLKPYRCPGGYLSIGYGHLIRKGEEMLRNGITEAQADSLLYNDMKANRDWVENDLHLSGNKLKAFTHFCYAFGITKLKKSELYSRIKANEPIEDQILKWVNIKGRPNSSLLRQRKLELAWYNSEQ